MLSPSLRLHASTTSNERGSNADLRMVASHRTQQSTTIINNNHKRQLTPVYHSQERDLPSGASSQPLSPSTSFYEMLNTSGTEWRNIDEVIKTTIRKMCDVIREQGLQIKEIEHVLPVKCNKSELNAGLSLKASVADVQRVVAAERQNMQVGMQQREIEQLLDDKVSKTELQRLILEIKVMNRQLEEQLSSKLETSRSIIDQAQLETQLKGLKQRFDELQSTKVNTQDLISLMEQKASKQSVAHALQRKANKVDLDAISNQKADLSDVEKLCSIVESKVDTHRFDEIVKLNNQRDDQVTAGLYDKLREMIRGKADRSEIDNLIKSITDGKINQEQRIQNLERDLDQVSNETKISVENLRLQMKDAISQKADQGVIDRLRDSIASKIDLEYLHPILQKVKQELNQQIEYGMSQLDFVRRIQDTEKSIFEKSIKLELDQSKLSEELQSAKEQINRVWQQVQKLDFSNSEDLKAQLERIRVEFTQSLSAIKTDAAETRIRQEENHQLDLKRVLKAINNKTDLSEVQEALNQCQQQVADHLKQTRDQVSEQLINMQDELSKRIDSKANQFDLNERLQKSEKAAITKYAQLSTLQSLDETVQKLTQQLSRRASADLIEEIRSNQSTQNEKLVHMIDKKSNLKDMCALLDLKSNIDDVNNALAKMHEQVEQRVTANDFQSHLLDQTLLNQVLVAENCVARWLWKSGNLAANGFAVPWEVQSVNTCPENFKWVLDQTTLVTVAPGLYEITLGFFSTKKPSVQVLVNGETIISQVNSSSYVIHHNSGKLTNTQKNAVKSQTGLTLIDFVALPARAQITVSYCAQGKSDVTFKSAEGFIGLRKL